MKATAPLAIWVLSLLMAGCATPAADEDPQGTTTQGEPRYGRNPAREATACGEPGTPSCDAPVVEEVHFEGDLGNEVRVCPPSPVGCTSTYASFPQRSVFIENPGLVLQEIQLTVTWTADTTLTEDLRFAVRLLNATGATILGEAEGSSPLAITVTGVDSRMEEGDSVWASVVNEQFRGGAGGASYYASTQQAFRMDGNVTFRR